MADKRNALDKHLGVTEQNPMTLPSARHRALIEHVGQALHNENYAAAQVYALLLVAESQQTETIDVSLTNWEDLAIAIGANIARDLDKIADRIDRLNR
jgi:hypothetical protein